MHPLSYFQPSTYHSPTHFSLITHLFCNKIASWHYKCLLVMVKLIIKITLFLPHWSPVATFIASKEDFEITSYFSLLWFDNNACQKSINY